MKVAVLHVTRVKINSDVYEELTVSSNAALTKNQIGQVSNESISFHNYFINSGFEWADIKQTISEINNRGYDGFTLWITPDVSKMPIFGNKIIDVVIDNIKPCGSANLCQRDGYLGPLKKGQCIKQYGVIVN